jgi:uroporphyrinogen III methyltransferase / synthase
VAETFNVLRGKRIVVTRAVEQSVALLHALRESAAIPVSLPMVSFAPPEAPGPLDDALMNLHGFDWIFLTSQNALRAMQDRCGLISLSLPQLIAGVRIAAVGPATSEAAEQAGIEVTYVAQKHQGVALAEELGERVRGMKVLLPRSDRANQDLVEALGRLGAQVTEVIAYKTIRPNEEGTQGYISELEKGADAILFFSPSAVHHLSELLGAAKFMIMSRTVAFVAIGPVTEKALRTAGVERVIIAKETHASAVLGALSDFLLETEQKLHAGVKRG